MATQTRTILVDDLDGSPASGTVEFGLDGRRYVIDLSAENAARLRAVLADFVAAARVRRGTPAPALRRRQAPRATVAAPAPRGTGTTRPEGPAVAGAPPPLLTELVEVVRDLAEDVLRALLEILAAVLDVLREQLAARRPRAPG